MTTPDSLPDPLVPAEVDLTDFRFMPLEVARLIDSEIMALENAEAFRAGVASWCKGWHQVPAASLPNDDGALCKTLGYGRDLKTWAKLRKAGALRGWVLCSDGRLYHPVVAEKALEAWLEKLAQRLSSGAGNAKRWGVEFDPTQINEQIATAREYLERINPQSKALTKRKPPALPTSPSSGNPPEVLTNDGRQSGQESRRDDDRDSGWDRNRQRQGQRQGQEEGTGSVKSSAGGPRARPAAEARPPAGAGSVGISAIREAVRLGFEERFDLPDRPIPPAEDELFADWIAAGSDRGLSPDETAAAVVGEVRRQFRRLDETGRGAPRSLRAVLDADVRTAIANARPGRGGGVKPAAEVPEPYAGHFEPVEFQRWIVPCVVSVSDRVATVKAPDRMHADWIAQRLEPKLRLALAVDSVEVLVAQPRPTAEVVPLMAGGA